MSNVGIERSARRGGLLVVCVLASLPLAAGCVGRSGGGTTVPADAQGDGAATDTGATTAMDSGVEDTGVEPPADVPVARDTGTAPRDTGSATFDTGTAPRDTGTAPRDTGTAPVDTGTAPVDTGVAGDAGRTFPPGVCGEPVAATTTGPTVNFSSIRVNWSMVCYDPTCRLLFVFVEDTENDMIGLRFYDYLGRGGPAAGDTVNLSDYRALAQPFFVQTMSGIQTEPMWRYERGYLAYEGTAAFTHLDRASPLGRRLRVEFRNLRARQTGVVSGTNRCIDIPNGGRMNVASYTLDLTVNNWATDEECMNWAGPPPSARGMCP